MNQSQDKRKEKLLKALREGRVKDDTTLGVFEMTEDLNERLDEEVPKITDIIKRLKGDKGEDSEVPGPQGEQGIQGIQGEQGEKGDKGDPGEPGKDGRDGIDGLNGKDGTTGQNGLPGANGSPDTPTQIADKLNTLEEAVDQKVIKGLVKKISDLSTNIAHNAVKEGAKLYTGTSETRVMELTKIKITGLAPDGSTPKLTISATEPTNPKLYDLWYDLS